MEDFNKRKTTKDRKWGGIIILLLMVVSFTTIWLTTVIRSESFMNFAAFLFFLFPIFALIGFYIGVSALKGEKLHKGNIIFLINVIVSTPILLYTVYVIISLLSSDSGAGLILY